MHALIISTGIGPHNIPSSLLPMRGRAVIDYVLADILNQKEISEISVITTSALLPLHKRHFSNSFPDSSIELTTDINFIGDIHDDLLICEGNVYTSLKMQDFIRAFKQFKRITTASIKLEENESKAPFFIIPQNESKLLLEYAAKTNDFTLAAFHAWLETKNIPLYTFKSGTGFCITI